MLHASTSSAPVPAIPALISVRGQRCLQAADVVVYDHLVHRAAAALARAGRGADRCRRRGAASRSNRTRSATCSPKRRARARPSSRLKWGDPFVFDSGGKEALFLHEQGIPFEVVPGIPAAIGVPGVRRRARSRIRARGDTLTFVRGHEGEVDAPPDVDWSQPRAARRHARLLRRRAAAWRDRRSAAVARTAGRRPAALIYDGTCRRRRRSPGRSPTSRAAGAHDGVAAVLVVGRVAGLREHLRWFDERPLFGKPHRRHAAARAGGRARRAARGARRRGDPGADDPDRAAGGRRRRSTAPARSVRRSTGSCSRAATASSTFMERLLATSDVRDLKGVRICARSVRRPRHASRATASAST